MNVPKSASAIILVLILVALVAGFLIGESAAGNPAFSITRSSGSPVALPSGGNSSVPVKVVIVTFWEPGKDFGDALGERQLWVEQNDFPVVYDFPTSPWPLRYNPEKQTLLITTGVGDIQASSAITALGFDPRFNLSRAYFIVSGVAGGDPDDVSAGSVVIARYVVDSDLHYTIDSRDLPPDTETGIIPLFRKKPYEQPVKTAGELYPLNKSLAYRVFNLTKDLNLTDNEFLLMERSGYPGYAAAQRPPFITTGDDMSGNTFWYGHHSRIWANKWMKYLTGNDGNYVVTAMEDAGVMRALDNLGKARKVDPERIIVLRAVCDHVISGNETADYEGLTQEGWFHRDVLETSIRNLYTVTHYTMDALVKEPQ